MRKETDIQKAIIEYLRIHPQVAIVYRHSASAVYDGTTFRKNTDTAGVSDIIGMLKDGRFLAIEVKRPERKKKDGSGYLKGAISDEQQTFIDMINRYGGVAGVAASIDDAQNILREKS